MGSGATGERSSRCFLLAPFSCAARECIIPLVLEVVVSVRLKLVSVELVRPMISLKMFDVCDQNVDDVCIFSAVTGFMNCKYTTHPFGETRM